MCVTLGALSLQGELQSKDGFVGRRGGLSAAGQVPVAAAALDPQEDRDGAQQAPAQAAEAAREAGAALQIQAGARTDFAFKSADIITADNICR